MHCDELLEGSVLSHNLYELLGVHNSDADIRLSGRTPDTVVSSSAPASPPFAAPFVPMPKSVVDVPVSAADSAAYQVLLQPEAEITRNVYFDFRIRYVHASKQSMLSSQPVAELVYETSAPVAGCESILDAQFAIRDTVLHIRARIKELSKAHRGQRFRLKVVFMGVTAYSNPIKVLSKSSIVRAHRTALAGPSAAGAAPASASASASAPSAAPASPAPHASLASLMGVLPSAAMLMTPQAGLPAPAPAPAPAAAPIAASAPAGSVLGKRKADDGSGASAPASASAVAALLAEQRTLHSDMAALRSEMRSLADSVAGLRDVLAAFFGVGVAPPHKVLLMDTPHQPQPQVAALAAVASAQLDGDAGAEPHDPLRPDGAFFRDML